MNALALFFDQIRLYSGQLLTFIFSYWILCIPVALFALNEVYELLRKIH